MDGLNAPSQLTLGDAAEHRLQAAEEEEQEYCTSSSQPQDVETPTSSSDTTRTGGQGLAPGVKTDKPTSEILEISSTVVSGESFDGRHYCFPTTTSKHKKRLRFHLFCSVLTRVGKNPGFF